MSSAAAPVSVYVPVNCERMIHQIELELGSLWKEAPKVLSKAVNQTARKVRKQMVKDLEGNYAFRSQLGSPGQVMRMKGAKAGNMTATLLAKGNMKELMDFMVTPGTPSWPAEYSAVSSKVLQKSPLKSLNGNPKPFITRFRSGHVAVVVRQPGTSMRGKPKKEALKKLLSPAIPIMLNNEEIRNQAKEMVMRELPDAITRQINRVLKSAK